MTTGQFSGNLGEWSEPYALLKLLADRKIYLGDSQLNRMENVFLPILEIIRQERYGNNRYTFSEDGARIIIRAGNDRSYAIAADEFDRQAVLLFEKIRSNTAGKASFSIPELESFLISIGFTRLKTASKSKSDIHITIHDTKTGMCPTLGFSIKSKLGSKATLFNASQATNFIFEIKNLPSGWQAAATKPKPVVSELYRAGGKLVFHDIKNKVFHSNLVLIDSLLPEIIAEMLVCYYSGKTVKVSELTELLRAANPNHYDQSGNHQFYHYKIKRFLSDSALGMCATDVWQGYYDATGGYLIIREDGEIVCYYIYNKNEFEDYLFCNTKFDTPSATRHKFGYIYEENGRSFIKLNLQIRFI